MPLMIRAITTREINLMETFLYEAIHVPPETARPPRNVIFTPEIHAYIKDFGKNGDVCFVAVRDGTIIGMAWVRVLSGKDNVRGYGNIDEMTPELAISVLPHERGQGVGEKLLNALHDELKLCGVKRVSLSVQKTNRALRLYKRIGYDIFEEQESDYLMVKKL